jgi:hypothetical protein
VDDEGCNEEGKGGKAMATVIKMVGNKEGKGDKKGNDVDNKGGM